jgi:putative transposase
MAEEYVTRAVVFPLDLSPSQERLAYSYAGARRFAYNWAIRSVRENLATRSAERAAGMAESELTPSLSWSAYSLNKAFNSAKEAVAPWWREVSMHAFRSGTADAAAALANFADSKKGARASKRVGFPHFKSRNRSTPSVSFVEINHQLSWFHPDRHGIRLMLPQSVSDPDLKRRAANLVWLHTTESTRRLYNLVESGRARIQKVTISFRGGRWQVSFTVRYLVGLPARKPLARSARLSGIVGLDVGLTHLATLDRAVPGLTDADGHVANPRVFEAQLKKLARLDRAISRTQRPSRTERGSKNRAKLRRRRARLHGKVAKTRALYLHRLTNALVHCFDAVAIEDLGVAAMSSHKHHLGRSMADASLGELRRQLVYKSDDRGTALVVIDRFYPSSKTCSCCGAVRAKLLLSTRVFECESCGASLDRDLNAARNIAREGARILSEQRSDQQYVAGLRPETQNADPSSQKTSGAHAPMAAVA